MVVALLKKRFTLTDRSQKMTRKRREALLGPCKACGRKSPP
jgi:hypothetical protein